jgi:hypothetical protein
MPGTAVEPVRSLPEGLTRRRAYGGSVILW